MTAKTINMHGKIYDLADEKARTKEGALKFAAEIRTHGKVAFLNPQKKKGQETMYFVYQAEKSERTSTKRNISIKVLLEEYRKGVASFKGFMLEIEKAQETPKEVPKKEVPKKETPKKITSKKQNSKKNGIKKNGKKK